MVYRIPREDGSVAIYYANPNSDCEAYRGSLIHAYSPEELSCMDQVEYDPSNGKYWAGRFGFDFPEAASKQLYLKEEHPVMASAFACQD